MSKKPFEPSTILVILGLMFIAAIGFRTISTPEIWTHLAQGRTNAPISFLATDSAVNTTWLYDKLAYAAWTVGKAPLLIILNIAGLLGTFILLIQVAKKWGGPLSQAFALLIAGHLMFQSLDVGPQVVMVLFIALFIYLLTSVKKPAVLFGSLIPLEILWTNMHGSFIYGPLLAALAAIQAAQQNKGPSRSRSKQSIETGTYGILATALLVSTLVNPYFFKMHAQVLAGLQSPVPAYWSSLFLDYFQIPPLKPLILFTIILGAGGLITLKKKLPVLLTAIAIYGAFLVIGTSLRMYLLFAVLAFPFMVLSLTAISEYMRSSLEQVLGEQAKLLVPATSTVYVLLVVLSLVPVISNCAYAKTGSASNFGLGVEEELYPNDVDAIIKDPAFPIPERTINLAADGGYLAFNYPDRKIFIDYRQGRYDKELLDSLDDMMSQNRMQNPKAFDAFIETYRPEAFIINTLDPAAAQGIFNLLSTEIWKLAYFDGSTAILILNRPSFASIINNIDAQKEGLAKLEAARAVYAKHADSSRAGNPAELIGAGKVFLVLNRVRNSKAIFSLLLQGNKDIPAAWIGLGESQLRLKEFEEAIASLKNATKKAKHSLQAWASYGNACRWYANRTKDVAKREALLAESERAIEKVDRLVERTKAKKEQESEPETSKDTAPQHSVDDLSAPLKL